MWPTNGCAAPAWRPAGAPPCPALRPAARGRAQAPSRRSGVRDPAKVPPERARAPGRHQDPSRARRVAKVRRPRASASKRRHRGKPPQRPCETPGTPAILKERRATSPPRIWIRSGTISPEVSPVAIRSCCPSSPAPGRDRSQRRSVSSTWFSEPSSRKLALSARLQLPGGKWLCKVWPEVTDPEKFVYEDVAIAAYLLILWEEERAERGLTARQSFIDLGCGNGLLVHILSSEGHPGRGIDVRRRKIWDMYGPQTRLEEDAITPNDKTLFPDVDWLIGNHSDELTPWIPVIAARSAYNCCFFVLPCCCFDFVGKYRRRQSKKTQYREYLDFIKEVGSACGFHVEEDCLRIPSTKRVCLVGKSRTYPPSREASMDEKRTQYINSRQGRPVSPPGQGLSPSPPQVAFGSTGHCDGHQALDAGVGCVPGAQAAEHRSGPQTGGPWLPGFHPREKTERVRNCAALPRDFIDQVVLQVANLLLGGKQSNTRSSRNGSVKTWNGGESLSLAEVASALDAETLRRLKRECGGLQTLLRNSHQVFRVVNGRVHIRDWREETPRKTKPPAAKRRLLSEACKTRLCWFFMHHPDGCALSADCCLFAHGPAELRLPQTRRKKTL
ncbi:putative tRNA (uracil-O(2)-)-methyltransferase isoform X4 [Callithrix jacchus]